MRSQFSVSGSVFKVGEVQGLRFDVQSSKAQGSEHGARGRSG